MTEQQKAAPTTDAEQILSDLDGGVFAQKMGRALSDVARNVTSTGKKGKVVVEFSFKQIGESNQVAMTHSLKFLVPTMRGRIVEESASDTPLHVGRGGKLSLYPGEQTEMFPQGGTTDAARNGTAASH